MWLVISMIIIGALAYRSATYIYSDLNRGLSARIAITFSGPIAREFLNFYVRAGLPLAFINGFLLRHSWIDCLVVGFGTWVGMLISIMLSRRFNAVLQFYVFAAISLGWLTVDAVLAFNP